MPLEAAHKAQRCHTQIDAVRRQAAQKQIDVFLLIRSMVFRKQAFNQLIMRHCNSPLIPHPPFRLPGSRSVLKGESAEKAAAAAFSRSEPGRTERLFTAVQTGSC